MMRMFVALFALAAMAACAPASADQEPLDEAALARFLEREASSGTADADSEKTGKLDTAASSLIKAPLDRSEGLVEAMMERGL